MGLSFCCSMLAREGGKSADVIDFSWCSDNVHQRDMMMQVVVSLPQSDTASTQALETLFVTAPSSMTAQQLLQARTALSPCRSADTCTHVCSILIHARTCFECQLCRKIAVAIELLLNVVEG